MTSAAAKGSPTRRGASRIVTIPLTELIEDLSVYPRNQVSSVNVSNLVAVLEAGLEFDDLIIADSASKRVVDGFHRRRAYLKVLGKDASVPVELRKYRSEGELLAAAVAANTVHGLPLGEFEKRQTVLRLDAMGVSEGQIARALHCPPAKIQSIRLKVATVVDDHGRTIRLQPLKRPLFFKQGQMISEEQAKAHASAPGTSYSLLIRQLRDALRFKLLDPNDGRTITVLTALAAEIDSYLNS